VRNSFDHLVGAGK